MHRLAQIAPRYARVALGASFLSAVSSRLGLWGAGSFDGFESYTAEVLSFMPASTIPFFARAATVLEIAFGIGLVLGIGLRWVAAGAAALLLVFAISMAISFGLKEPLDYSVFSASACALLLARPRHGDHGSSVDCRAPLAVTHDRDPANDGWKDAALRGGEVFAGELLDGGRRENERAAGLFLHAAPSSTRRAAFEAAAIAGLLSARRVT